MASGSSPRGEGEAGGVATLPSRVLHGHSAWVNALVVAHDGRALYTAGEDRRVCVFVPDDGAFASGAGLAAWAQASVAAAPGDDAAGACVALARVLHGHARPVLALALSDDGERLFSASDEGELRAWAVGAATPPPRAEAARDCGGIGLGLGLDDPDRDRDEDDESEAAADDAACVARLRGHTGPVRCMLLSPDGSALFSAGGGDCAVRRWDVAAVRRCGVRGPDAAAQPHGAAPPPPVLHPTHAMAGHAAAVAAMAFARGGAWLLSASRDGSARLWDAASGAPAALMLPPGGDPDAPRPALEVLAVASTGDVALTGAEDGAISVWALPPPPSSGIRGVGAPSSSGPPRRIAPALALPLSDNGVAPVTALAASGPGAPPRAFAGAQDGGLRAWALSGAALRALWAAPEAHAACVKALALSPDGATLYSASFDALLRAWDAATGTPTATLAAHAWQVRALALSPGGATLYSAAADNTVRAWTLRPPRAAADSLAALVSSIGSSLALPTAGERSCGGSIASAAAAVQAYDVAGALNDAHAWGSAAAQYAAAAAAAAPAELQAAAALAAADAPGPYDVAASLSALLQHAAQHSASDDDDDAADPAAAPRQAVAKLAATADAIGAATSAAALTAAAEAALPAADAAARETLTWALKSLRTGAAAAAQTAAQTVAAAAAAAGAPPAAPGPALTVDGGGDADVAPLAWHTFRGEVAGGPVGGGAASPASPAGRGAPAAVAAAATSALGDISAYFMPQQAPGSPLTPAAAAAAIIHPLMAAASLDDAHAL